VQRNGKGKKPRRYFRDKGQIGDEGTEEKNSESASPGGEGKVVKVKISRKGKRSKGSRLHGGWLKTDRWGPRKEDQKSGEAAYVGGRETSREMDLCKKVSLFSKPCLREEREKQGGICSGNRKTKQLSN